MKSWMSKASCSKKRIPPEYFFDEYLKSLAVFALVNATCSECEVRAICLRYGKNTKSSGVWGGKWLQYGQVVTVEVSDSEGYDEQG